MAYRRAENFESGMTFASPDKVVMPKMEGITHHGIHERVGINIVSILSRVIAEIAAKIGQNGRADTLA